MGCGASSAATPPRQLVLLGGGECGKTTIFKQIQIVHGTGFGGKAAEWVDAIHRSPLRTVKTLCTAVQNAELELSEANKANKELVLGNSSLTPELATKIKELLADPAIIKVQTEQQDLDLDDNAKYFLAKIDDLAKPGYEPDQDDILKVRDPTRTIETLDFQFGKAKFRVIDVGGQRMERPKWNLTGEITAVIFVCSLIEYTQMLREDIKQNRLKESLNLFDIASNRRYPDKPIILFLNKRDLFEAKIKNIDLKICFPTYKGGCNYDAALEYIKFKFRTTRKDKEKQLFIFETTATDTANMTHIISSMIEIVQNENLTQCGFG